MKPAVKWASGGSGATLEMLSPPASSRLCGDLTSSLVSVPAPFELQAQGPAARQTPRHHTRTAVHCPPHTCSHLGLCMSPGTGTTTHPLSVLDATLQAFPSTSPSAEQPAFCISVHGILQARILEWAATAYSRGPSQTRDGTSISCVSCIAGRFFTIELPGKPHTE